MNKFKLLKSTTIITSCTKCSKAWKCTLNIKNTKWATIRNPVGSGTTESWRTHLTNFRNTLYCRRRNRRAISWPNIIGLGNWNRGTMRLSKRSMSSYSQNAAKSGSIRRRRWREWPSMSSWDTRSGDKRPTLTKPSHT